MATKKSEGAAAELAALKAELAALKKEVASLKSQIAKKSSGGADSRVDNLIKILKANPDIANICANNGWSL